MRVLGIDPGSETTGWGLVEGEGHRYHVVEFGTVKAPARETFSSRLLKISDGITGLIERLRPDACALEDGFYATNVKVALKLGQVRGVVVEQEARDDAGGERDAEAQRERQSVRPRAALEDQDVPEPPVPDEHRGQRGHHRQLDDQRRQQHLLD